MIQVIPVVRKSAVLTPSGLKCLAHIPTINLTAGCACECAYCYARGYLTDPGEGKITFYTNTLAKLREEIEHKRKKPTSVYFSPSTDPFQPVPQVLDMAYNVFKLLLESGIGVVFLTKGRIPRRHRELLAAHAGLVQARIGLTTLDRAVSTAFERRAAPPAVRLAQVAELIHASVAVEVRLDPIIPGITDGQVCLELLFAALAQSGVRAIAASILFLRPAVTASLRRNIADKQLLNSVLDCFASGASLPILAGHSRVFALPMSARFEIFERVKSIAQRFGLEAIICACKNPDLASGCCHIAGRLPAIANAEECHDASQLELFHQ